MKSFSKHLDIVILLGLLLPLATLPLTPVNAITPKCPTHLTTNKTLSADCTGTIYIAANSVTLNCSNHHVSGPGTYGVEVAERLHVTVENCKITGFMFGLYVAGTNSSTFKNNNATANTTYGVYVTLNQTHYINDASTSNTFSGNVAKSNGGGGFFFYYSYGNTLTSNSATSNTYGFGFEYSDGNILMSNTATSNYYGFYIVYSYGNTLTSNSATSDHFGFYIALESYGNILTSNTATSNSDGFDILYSDGNTLKSNTAKSNSNDGFYLYQSLWNTLSSNTAKSNSNDGFFFDSTTSVNWVVSNTASSNAHYDAEQAPGASNLFVTNSFTITTTTTSTTITTTTGI